MIEAGKTIVSFFSNLSRWFEIFPGFDKFQTALVVMEDEAESNKVLWMFELGKFVEVDAKLVEQWELGMCVKSDAWTIESKGNRVSQANSYGYFSRKRDI